MKQSLLAMILLLSASLLPAGAVDNTKETTFEQVTDKWRQERLASVTSKDGWLTVVGLFWLQEGENKFGSDEANAVVFPKDKAPAHAGSFFLEKGQVRLEPNADAGITSSDKPASSVVLQSDEKGDPTILKMGPLTFFVIKRGDKIGIRLKDKDSDALNHFAGLKYYPPDPKWRVEAKWIPFNPPKKIQILNVLGMLEDKDCEGAVEFTVGGKPYRLDALVEGEGEEKALFLIFGDQTNGKETYGAGRFLYSDPADANGKVVVDFNQSYSPPCALTAFATCPLPPKQNKLPLRIEAGEKKYH